jgi:ABC-type transporter MlaC component
MPHRTAAIPCSGSPTRCSTGEQPSPFGVIARSRIIKGNAEPVDVNYMMRRIGDGWLISDVY